MRHLTEALRSVKEDVLSELRVMLPATIERYDHTTQKAAVLPSLSRRYVDGEVQDMPVIEDVPVVWPRTGTASLTMPMRRGDGVMLVMSDRSLDRWKQRGGKVTPDDRRKHALPDCVAVPGLYSFADPSPQDNNEDTVLRQGSMEVRLKPDGTVRIDNGTEELLTLIDEIGDVVESALSTLSSETVIIPSGSSSGTYPLTGQGTYAGLQSDLAAIRARLQDLTG